MTFAFLPPAEWSSVTVSNAQTIADGKSGLSLLHPDTDVTITQNGKTVVVSANDLVVVDRSIPIVIDADGDWSARLLNLRRLTAIAHLDRTTASNAVLVDGQSAVGDAIKRLWAIGEDLSRTLSHDRLAQGYLTELIARMIAQLAASGAKAALSENAAYTLGRAELMIFANLADPSFGMKELAEGMRLSQRYLSSMFARLGTTASQSILEARLAQARALLVQPANAKRQIASIAAACGFADQAYFSRCFRREVGMTPREFRRLNGKAG